MCAMPSSRSCTTIRYRPAGRPLRRVPRRRSSVSSSRDSRIAVPSTSMLLTATPASTYVGVDGFERLPPVRADSPLPPRPDSPLRAVAGSGLAARLAAAASTPAPPALLGCRPRRRFLRAVAPLGRSRAVAGAGRLSPIRGLAAAPGDDAAGRLSPTFGAPFADRQAGFFAGVVAEVLARQAAVGGLVRPVLAAGNRLVGATSSRPRRAGSAQPRRLLAAAPAPSSLDAAASSARSDRRCRSSRRTARLGAGARSRGAAVSGVARSGASAPRCRVRLRRGLRRTRCGG